MNVRKLFKVSLMNRGGEWVEAAFQKCALQIPPIAREWKHFCNGYILGTYFLITGIIFG
jgi:hypothetical protein